jgi:two-component system response regulator GlrR
MAQMCVRSFVVCVTFWYSPIPVARAAKLRTLNAHRGLRRAEAEVPHKLLIVEDASSPLEGDWERILQQSDSMVARRHRWNSFHPEQLGSCPYNVLVASAVPRCEEALRLFEWLRRNPLPIASLAILPDGDREMLQAAVEAVDDFLLAPVREEELRHRLARLLSPPSPSLEQVQNTLIGEAGLGELVGRDPVFLHALAQVAVFAPSEAPVLLTGETGTGKELCARVIHLLSKRRDGPFIPVDCGALPEHLFENELFGHSRGAFTDARSDQKGLVALARGGTLFIDEVDSLSTAAQAKLLRLLQENNYRPLGSESFQNANVRVITATNNDLETLVRKGQFRADLFFRINVLCLHLPALRHRRRDIELLAQHFIRSLCRDAEMPVKILTREAALKLEKHDWLGNVRELFNVIQRAVLNSPGRHVGESQVEFMFASQSVATAATDFRNAKAQVLKSFEHDYVEQMLKKHNGNITRAAMEAGKDRRAFGRLAKKYGLQREAS